MEAHMAKAKRRNAAPIQDRKSHMAAAKVTKNDGTSRKGIKRTPRTEGRPTPVKIGRAK